MLVEPQNLLLPETPAALPCDLHQTALGLPGWPPCETPRRRGEDLSLSPGDMPLRNLGYRSTPAYISGAFPDQRHPPRSALRTAPRGAGPQSVPLRREVPGGVPGLIVMSRPPRPAVCCGRCAVPGSGNCELVQPAYAAVPTGPSYRPSLLARSRLVMVGKLPPFSSPVPQSSSAIAPSR